MPNLGACPDRYFAGRFATALPAPNAVALCGRLGSAALGALSYHASSFGCATPAALSGG